MIDATKQSNGLIYYRVSTEEQAQFGISLEQQENACKEHANRLDIAVKEIFHDDGVSAKTADREGLQAMLTYCTKHYKEIDYVIVYKIDRLSRNVNDYSSILVLLTKLNIQLLSVT
jgi:site-specific DNA recombinase